VPVAVVFLLRAVVLILLWGFVIAVVVAVRHDVFNTKASRITAPAAGLKPASTPPPPKPPKAPKAPRRAKAAPPVGAVATRVTVIDGPHAGRSVALSSLPVTIGRAPESNIVLNDDYVSNQHAQLVPRGREWLITDTGSTNGTFIGDKKVTAPTVVPVGGQIRIGKSVLELQA
jgi:pSer/pThr/pTyr-binding forkhead associated (FHA) protein